MVIFSKQTEAGLFTICTPDETFNITPHTYGCKYTLHANDRLLAECNSPYDAMQFAAGHGKGWKPEDWTPHFDDRLRVKLIADYIDKGMALSYRELDDYFHFKHPYLMDRMKVAEMLEDLAMSGQLRRPLSKHMMPSGFRRVARLFEKWYADDTQD